MRARLAIFSAELKHEHREIVLKEKPKAFLDLSSKGTVPVLLTENNKLIENLDALQNLKFQQALQQLEDGTTISKTRKEIAQIKTVLKEYKLGIRVTEGEKE